MADEVVQKKKKKKWWIVLIVIVVIIVIAVAAGSGDSEDTASDSNPQKVGETASGSADATSGESTQTEFAKGDVLETSSLKISYLDCGKYTDYSKYLAPDKGNKVIYATFEFENISDEDQFVSSYDFTCYADGYDCDEFYGGDEETLSATLSAGKKTKGTVLFEVPKDAKEITLEYEVDYWTSDKITFVIE